MMPDDLPRSVREALHVWEAFRRLGYMSRDIFLGVYERPYGTVVTVELHWMQKVFSVVVAGRDDNGIDGLVEAVPLTPTDVEHWWVHAATALAEDDVFRKVMGEAFPHSLIMRNAVGLVTKMLAKGFSVSAEFAAA